LTEIRLSIFQITSLRFLFFVHTEDSEGTVPGMRNKTVVWAYLIVLSLGTIFSLYIPKNEVVAKEAIVIPGDAIRLRILANSDKESDQALKRKVRDAVNAQITLWVQDLTSLEKAKTVIKEKLPEIQAIADRVVLDHGSDQSVKVQFGNVQFPTKLYGEFLYPAGEYEAVLITLGAGKGANWWCVLYPPLCFLDFSNGVAVSDGFDDEKAKAGSEVGHDSSVGTDSRGGTDSSVGADSRGGTISKEGTASKVGTGSMMGTASEVGTASEAGIDSKVEPAPNQVMKARVAEKNPRPVYTAEDEQPVKVKFFVVELWQRIFD
jgi:stage II sporulation protein R